MKFPAIALILASLLGAGTLYAAEVGQLPASKLQATKNESKVEAPKDATTIINTVCAACHNADGNSVITTNPRLAGQIPEYLVKQLKNFQSGERANPVMAPMAAMLTPEDMTKVAAYFASQKPKGGNAKENGPGSLGEKIYKGGIAALSVPACAGCHGPAGSGIPVRFPRLSGQHADYTMVQLKAFRSGERANAPMMKAIAARMTDQDIAAVADYIQGLH